MAYQRWWKTIRDQQGNAVNGASCAVYNGGTGTLATVYDPNTDDSAPGSLANPFTTTANGVFGFMAANGEYDVQISGGNGATQQYRVTLNGFVSGSAASLSVDLAAQTGAGLVGFGDGQTYPAGTVGAALNSLTDVTSTTIPAAFAAADAVVTAAFQAADTAIDTRLDAVEVGQSSAVVGYDTQANLYANLVPIANSVAYVMNDSTPSLNGTYRKVGGTGTGSWVQSSYDRVALVETKTAGIGITYDVMIGNGVGTSAYLNKYRSDDYLTKRGGWEGTQTLYSTSRKNLQTYSEQFDSWTKAAGVTVTADAGVAPDGTTTADLIDLTAASVSTGIAKTVFTATGGLQYYDSIWLKGVNGGEVIDLKDGGSSGTLRCTLTTDWQRFSVPITAAGVAIGCWVQKVSSGTLQFYAWGAQSMLAPLSSYIKTTNTTTPTVTDYTVSDTLVTLAAAPATGETVQWTPAVPKDAQDLGDTIAACTVKATPVDADSLGLSDSAAGNILKKLTWANLKATLKTYFDTTYIKLAQSGILTTDIFKIDIDKTLTIVGPSTGPDNVTHRAQMNAVGMGYGVFTDLAMGYDSVGVGCLALRSLTDGGGHTCVGNQAGYAVTTAYYITAYGDGALRDATGDRNTAFGAYAGRYLTTGADNLILGWHAGDNLTTESNTFIVDNQHRASAAAEVTGSILFGNFSGTASSQWLNINGDVRHRFRVQVLGKAVTANGATTTFTYPANTRYQYITTSAASLATTLPATSAALDGTVITFVAGSAVATATWVAGSGGATIVGAPAALVANTPVRMIYHHATTSWYPY